ncbi:MAG TPA: polysaccharide deacetylase family protein [Thermoleophilaceae bacterium]|nr:polysaccharide deacetylase family protein [Thermoleophilaceae bacterium]
MTRLELLVRRPLAFVLLALSSVPFLLVVPQMVESRQLYERRHQSGPLPAPLAELTPAQRLRFQPLPPYARAVPVLAYHGIGAEGDARSVRRRIFAEQMAALRHMGFQTISIAQYARFRRGDTRGLPARPLLITFDGGRLDSYRGADRVLARNGFRATMFVVTGEVERENPTHLTWRELHTMRDSRRWDVQPETRDGHARVAYDSAGHTAPFYSVRRYTTSDGRESFADYERRVTTDVFAVKDDMEEHGFESVALAVPYGDYGQRQLGNTEVALFMRGLLSRQFPVWFTDDELNAPDYTRPRGEPKRFEVNSAITTDRLYMWLRDHAPHSRGGRK